ncbi:MAG: excinuclease ABC subunit A, partial [Planctomycetales bacterium]|nr:excinuclease ABC subunit A [Planctomycetales bacterium]
LHFDDLAKLLEVMQRLVDLGNTVVVIEHNLDVIKQADWVIDMGPEAGEAGGQVVIAGTPEQVVEYATTQSRGSDRRSYTGEALAPILAAGPYVLRPTYSAEEHAEAAEEKFKIAEVIGDAAMPWEKDGRGWHTRDRVGRNGEPCRWDGRILADVIDRIYELGTFSETNWNSRSVVEIAAETKSYGWFLHAITGETWLLKLKFRVPSNTFQSTKLRADLPLKTLNEMYDIPLYSNDPRIKIKSTRGPLQEIELRLHGYEEIDRPAFWHFLETAVEAFQRFASDAPKTLDEHMPWKKLGKKWHLMRKGFPNGKRIAWEVEVLEALCGLLEEAAPNGQFTWTNQQLVHMHVPGQKEPWATLHTKRPGSLDLTLTGPKGQIGFGRVSELGFDREFDDKHAQRDQIQLRFRSESDLQRGDLPAFLSEHLAGVNETATT